MQSISKRFTTNLSGLLMPCLMLPSPCMATVRDEFIAQTVFPKVHVERRLSQSCHCGHYVTCDLRGHEPCICRVLRCMYGHPLVLPVSYINCLMSQVYESITESGLCGQCLEIRANQRRSEAFQAHVSISCHGSVSSTWSRDHYMNAGKPSISNVIENCIFPYPAAGS